jgi:hypothetical protein
MGAGVNLGIEEWHDRKDGILQRDIEAVLSMRESNKSSQFSIGQDSIQKEIK